MAGGGSEGMGHIGRDYHQISFLSRDYSLAGEELQLPIQNVEEFGGFAVRVRPRSLDSFPHCRSHDAERTSSRVAIGKQARGKLRQAKNLRIGLAHNDSVIKIRYYQGHRYTLSFLDTKQAICYYLNVKIVTNKSLNVKYLNVNIHSVERNL